MHLGITIFIWSRNIWLNWAMIDRLLCRWKGHVESWDELETDGQVAYFYCARCQAFLYSVPWYELPGPLKLRHSDLYQLVVEAELERIKISTE